MVFQQDHANAVALGLDPFEALTVTPGAKFATDLRPVFAVVFETAFPLEDVSAVVRRMCTETKRVLSTF